MHVGERHKHVYDLRHIPMTNYGVVNDLYIFKMLTEKNVKRLELGFLLNQLPYITELKYLPITVCFQRDKY